MYAAVQRKPIHHRSLDSLDQLRIPIMLGDDDDDDDDDLPPPLPERPLDLGHTLKKTHSLEDVVEVAKSEGKPKKGGFKFFKKKPQRKLSDGNVASQGKTENCTVSTNARHRRSKSQADAENIIPGNSKAEDCKESYAEIIIPTDKDGSVSNEVPSVKAYLEVDITEPPPTPKELKKQMRFMEESDEGQSEPFELPDGWKEVKSESGTYYWHVASGTTQWDPPHVATRPKVQHSILYNTLKMSKL